MEQQVKLKTITQGDIPAPATLEFMEKVNTKIGQLEERTQQICKKLDVSLQQNTEDHKRLFDKIDELIQHTDNEYANKEEFKFWRNVVISGILVAIFLGVIALFLK